MACSSGPISPINVDQGGLPNNLPSLSGADLASPGLFVSNAPEQLGDGGGPHWQFVGPSVNLCRVRLTGDDVPSRVRVFFWHISRFNVTTYWSIRVGSEGTGGTVSNLVGEIASTDITGNLSVPGMCLADSQLFGTLDEIGEGPWDIESEQGIWSIAVPAGSQNVGEFRLLAAVLEFDVTASEILTIRSVVTKTNGTWGTYGGTLAPSANNFDSGATHVRGYWRHAAVTLTVPMYDADPEDPPPTFRDTGLCDEGGPEQNYYSAANSLADSSTRNPGCFGADLTYEGAITNTSTNLNAEVRVALRCRGIATAKFFGAGQMTDPATGPTLKLVPIPAAWIQVPLDPAWISVDPRGYDLTQTASGNIFVPKTATVSQVINYRFRLATGGGAGTPVNLQLSRSAISADPPGGGGDS